MSETPPTHDDAAVEKPRAQRDTVIGVSLLGFAAFGGALGFCTSLSRSVDGIAWWGQEKAPLGPTDVPVYLVEALFAAAFILSALAGCLVLGLRQQKPHLAYLGLVPTGPSSGYRGFAAVSLAFAVILAAHLLSQLLVGLPLLGGQSINDDLLTGFAVGARASLEEEGVDLIFIIGIPMALVIKYGFAKWPRVAQVAFVALLVIVSSGIRGMQHIYQGDYRLYVTFVLGVGFALIFLWARSVWPLIIAHWVFDWLYTSMSQTVVVPLVIVVIATGIMAWRLRHETPSPSTKSLAEF